MTAKWLGQDRRTRVHLATWEATSLALDHHLCADDSSLLNFWIKQEKGTKQKGAQGTIQASDRPRTQGVFCKPAEKERAGLTQEIALPERERGWDTGWQCAENWRKEVMRVIPGKRWLQQAFIPHKTLSILRVMTSRLVLFSLSYLKTAFLSLLSQTSV